VSVSAKAFTAAMVTAALIFEGGLDATPVSPRARPLIINALDWFRREKRFGMPRKETMELFGHGLTRQLKIEQSGELESYLDGGARKITIASACKRQIALALISHPLDGPELKVRLPPGRYQKRRREPTPQEPQGLRIGTAGRAAETRQRRAAKAAAKSL
jgi:hypothetical protein